jgi:hypothetical protein
MEKNRELSKRLARKVRSRPQQCYLNAWRVVERELPGAAYVEGIALLENKLCLEHGWVENGGEIIDPTLPDDKVIYFPGLRFVGRDGLKQAQATPGMLECGCYLPIFYRLGWGGAHSPEFTLARVQAEKFAFGQSPHEER